MDRKYQAIPGDDLENEGGSRENEGGNVRWPLAVIVLTLCTGTVGMLLKNSTSRTFQGDALNSQESLDFHVGSVSYTDSPADAYDFLDSGRFVEPFRPTLLTIKGASLKACDWSISFVSGGGPWDDIVGASKTTGFSSSGRQSKKNSGGTRLEPFEVQFSGPGVYSVSLTCDHENGKTETYTDEVSCRYVRRELRELTLVDREAFLDAFMVMYRTSAEDGIKSFGIHFQTVTNFVNMHLDSAAKRNTDHIHDGLGLATQHIALTMEFELSLQSITPRLAVPYWDYTLDSAKIQKRDPDNYFTSISSIFHESELFTDDFFGYSDMETPYVSEGRFSHVKVTRDYSAPVHSARGFLRAPWNLNPSARVTRFHSLLGSDEVIADIKELEWPTCANHLGLTTGSAYDTWFEWSWDVGYVPHGPVHSWIGGVGGGDGEAMVTKLYEDGILTKEQYMTFRIYSFVLIKNLWKDKVIEMPKSCSEDAPVSECTWACVEDPISNFGLVVAFATIVGFDTSDNENLVKALRSFCDMTFWPGDQLEGSSPIEASFWTIHPTLDRLLQYKDLVQPFTDMTWVLDTEGIAHSGDICLYSDCEGHHAVDLTFWKSVTKNTDGSYSVGYLTNEEVRNAALPSREYLLPYVYNSFEWKHCDELGHVFPKVSK